MTVGGPFESNAPSFDAQKIIFFLSTGCLNKNSGMCYFVGKAFSWFLSPSFKCINMYFPPRGGPSSPLFCLRMTHESRMPADTRVSPGQTFHIVSCPADFYTNSRKVKKKKNPLCKSLSLLFWRGEQERDKESFEEMRMGC